MPTLSIKASGFVDPYKAVNGTRTISVSKRQLMKFAASIGLPILRAASPTTRHAVALAIYKSLAIKCAVDFSSPSICRPSEYEHMDQSEKANISYWTGMTFAALLADECLGVSRLVHATAFGRLRLARVNPRSRRLADLVGQDDAGAWHIVESKARQTGASGAVRADWKTQAQTVATIDGVAPATRSYSFTRVGQAYSTELVDPQSEEQQRPVEIKFKQSAIIMGYYDPILEWLSEGTATIERGSVRLVMRRTAFDPVDGEFVFLGMTEDVMKKTKCKELPQRQDSKDLTDTYIGSDGLAIITSSKEALS